MLKTRLLLLFSLMFLVSSVSNSQYTLQKAFPNLPNFTYPVEMVTPDDGTNRLFVVQQWGKIFVFNNSPAVSNEKVFIDLGNKIYSSFETGIFGLAFHPDYVHNRHFYVHYIFDSAGSPTNKWIRVARYTASASNPDTALQNTEVQLLKAPLIGGTLHDGGKLAFGPDGYLYISFGDGYTSGYTSQDLTLLLGKLLRINVDSASGGKNYSIPVSNPFYGNSQGYREEIYAYGLRNMWKFCFDFPTNRLYGADVGESAYEEINLIENGKNYGWNKMEGFHCYGVCDTTGMGFARPIFEYSHAEGQSITGGYVYRGALQPELYGKFIFGDFQNGRIWALNYDGINPTTSTLLLDTTFRFTTFGVDQNNEIYVASFYTGVFYKIVRTDVAILDLKASIEGFLNTQTDLLNMSDTISVYLRSTLSPYPPVDSSRSVLDSVSSRGLCFFNNAQTGKYYLVIKHRNALETWNRAGGDSIKRGSTASFDFTNDSSKAYGNNVIKKGNKYCLYSGDINHDGNIDALDVSAVDNDAFNFVSGYAASDVTGNNVTDASDIAVTDNNAFNFVSKITPP